MRLLLVTILIFAFFAKSSLAKYYPSDDVVELTPSNFDKLVTDDSIWVIKFYAEWCGHCQSLEPEYKKVATALKGIIKVGAVNADEHKSLGSRFNIQGFPTIKIFGVTKNSPTDLEHSSRTAKGIAEAALAAAKKRVNSILGGSSSSSSSSSSGSDDVIELTDSNFDKLVLNSDDVWLVEFMAPWCGHCKNLAPHWAKAASELKGKVKLGVLDATAHQAKAQEYGVRGYPTIKFFPGGKKSKSDAEDFNGGRTSADIVTFALEKYADNIPAPELLEITSEDAFNRACEGKPLCVVSVLPHILDCNAKCRNEFLGILRELADKFKKKSWGWVWSEGGAQTALEESLEIGGFGYPAMTLVNFKKMKFSILKGSFSKDGLNEFLRDISYGRGQTAPVRGAVKPNINKVEAWDGKDGQLPEEEEIDLSDVDLDEKIEL